jgi:hypothetical protein
MATSQVEHNGRDPFTRNACRLADELASLVLQKPIESSELLMTSVPSKDGLDIRHVQGMFSGRIPLRALDIQHWPSTISHLFCLHCGGPCDVGPPVPCVRNYEAQLDRYWVYGPFCRASCSIGYLCESDSTSKQLAPTIELLRRYFGQFKIRIAPPRAAHVRFGGPLEDGDFHGTSGYTCLNTIQPPFVTFANYVVGVHQETCNEPETSRVKQTTHALLPQSAGALVNLERKSERFHDLLEKKSTNRPPLILEFLSTLKSAAHVKDASQDIELKAAVAKKRKTNDVSMTTGNDEPKGFLRQFMKKKE